MADKKISDFTASSSIAAGDLVEIETAGGNSRKVTGTNAALSFQNLAFRGALVKKSTNQTGANYTGAPAIGWDAETYDTDGFHSNVSNTSRITIPSGVTKVRLAAAVTMQNVTADVWIRLFMGKNGGSDFDGEGRQTLESGQTTPFLSCVSAVVDVTAGDYFEVFLQIETDTSIDVVATQSWFSVEVIG